MRLVPKVVAKVRKKGFKLVTSQDDNFMLQAVKKAREGIYTTTPNPRVGCVVVKDSTIIGQGAHISAGAHHAEIIALNQAGEGSKGASVYTTLEPCNISGETGPCTKRIINSGVRRVIIAMKDPNPRVNGSGIKDLKAAGIEVTCGVLEPEAINLNLGFIKRMKYGLPWVRSKIAMSTDGYSALLSGQSKWITGQEARDDGHKWRARSCMVMTGIGTLIKDNPQLNVRSIKTVRQPTKVLIDSNLELDTDCNFFDAKKTLVFTSDNSRYNPSREKQFKEKEIEIIRVKQESNNLNHLDLKAVLTELSSRGCNELHLEAGAKLNDAFMNEKLIDELLIYVAPIFLGNGLPILDSKKGSIMTLHQASKWTFMDTRKFGEDMRIILRRRGFDSLDFLHQDNK